MTTVSGTREEDLISDEAWEAFWYSQKTRVAAVRSLLDDPPSLRAVEATDDKTDILDLYSLTPGVGDGDVDEALRKLQNSTQLPNHPGTDLIKQNGQEVKAATDDADQKVKDAVADLKKKVDSGSHESQDDWNNQMDKIRDE